MSPTLRLTRDVGSAAFELRRGQFEILVDDKPVGSISNHDTVVAPVELTVGGVERHGSARIPARTSEEVSQHEGVLIDLDGNIIRFGSPLRNRG